ncbi:MAG: GNAT family N-acetyltransferase [Clostridiales bacterium]|nr:GNAT family N-acetyltransferase [Clostridiales bacterium]
METVLASSLGGRVRQQMSAVFVDGYYQMGLRYLSKDKEKLARAFAHMFDLDLYYLALDENGGIIGMAACTDGNTPSVHLDAAALRRHLGAVEGSIAHPLFKRGFENTDTPFPFLPGLCNVEFVATAEKFRGPGVATPLIRDLIAATPYRDYMLDVADSNVPAVKVYEKIGFQDFMRVPQNPALAKWGGFHALVYMKYTKPE